jgi:hypothetical protein
VRGYKGQNGRTQVQEDKKKTTYKGELQREHQVPKPPPIARSISNKKRVEVWYYLKYLSIGTRLVLPE